MRYYDFSQNILLRTSPEKPNDNGAYVRIVHTATKAPDMDLYINDKLLVPDLRYREFTDYIKLPDGTYNIKVYSKNTKSKPLIDLDIHLKPHSIVTYAIYSNTRLLSLYLVEEATLSSPTKRKAKIRISNLIENISPVDIYLSDGTLLYKNVSFKDTTKYIELPPNNYIVDIKLADSTISMLYIPNMNLNADNYYTLYLIGLINDYPEPQMLIPLDGITYLKS